GGELNRLVLDRPEQAGRQNLGIGEGLAVLRALDEAGPAVGTRARLVEEKHHLAAAAEQHRIPAWLSLLLGGDLGFGPRLAVVAMRAPLAPRGWPIAMAPPRTFTFSGLALSTLMTASAWAAKASLISIRSMSSSLSPARSSALCVAGTGPMPITDGSTPATA